MDIFPKEIIENCVEIHRFKNTVRSKIIYGSILISIVGLFLSLPFVFINVYSSSKGIITSEKKRNQISSLNSGKIEKLFLEENSYVKKGDTLVVLDNNIGKEKAVFFSKQQEKSELMVKDLSYLTEENKINQQLLKSEKYKKEYIEYKQKLSELHTSNKKNKKDFIRQKNLYDKGVISKVELEKTKYELDLTLSHLSYFKKQMQNKWQSTLVKEQNMIVEIESGIRQIGEESKTYIITASIDGTVQNLIGLEVGDFINPNKIIAEISPDTELIVECYISPTDIGLLKKGNLVKFQVDAFNYNQWGVASGEIIKINEDVTYIDNIPLFRTICSIDQKNLELKNGFRGKLKKGMTVNVSFFIARRSIYQLLYDQLNNWMNPN